MSYFILIPLSVMFRARAMTEMRRDSPDPFVGFSAQHEPVNSSQLGPNVLDGHMQFFIWEPPPPGEPGRRPQQTRLTWTLVLLQSIWSQSPSFSIITGLLIFTHSHSCSRCSAAGDKRRPRFTSDALQTLFW